MSGGVLARSSLPHLALAALTGAVIAAQSRINGGLAAGLGDPALAAFTCFVSAVVLLGIAVLCSAAARSGLAAVGSAARARSMSPLALVAGLGGAGYVAGQSFSVPRVGVALFTIAAVAGQLTFSLLSDRWGLGPTGRRPVTPRRLAAAAGAVLAVVVAVSDRLGSAHRGSGLGSGEVLSVGLGLAAGAGIALQIPLNGRVAQAARSNLASALLNAAVATVALGVLLAVVVANRGVPTGLTPQPWYLYSGGLISATNVLAVTVAILRTGVLAFAVCQVLGVVVCAVVMDLALPVGGAPVTVATVVGAAVLLAAALALVTDRRS